MYKVNKNFPPILTSLRQPKNEDDMKNEDNLKNEEVLKNEDNLKNEDILRSNYELKMKTTSRIKKRKK